MTQFLKAFQDMAAQWPSVVLVFIGFVLSWLGLCLWLGGLRWLKFFAGLTVAGIGYAAASAFTDRQIYFLVGIPVLVGLFAICFEKTTVILLTATLASLIICMVLSWSTLSNPQTWQNPPAISISTDSSQLNQQTVMQSLAILQEYLQWVARNVWNAVQSLGSTLWIISGVAVLTFAALGFLFPRGICAVTCASFGVVLISFGMFFMLMYKGSRPADVILANPTLFEIITAAMIVFGLLVNLAIAPAKKRKHHKTEEVV